jgi:hypothetical protein
MGCNVSQETRAQCALNDVASIIRQALGVGGDGGGGGASSAAGDGATAPLAAGAQPPEGRAWLKL